jgi:hypothetical protein
VIIQLSFLVYTSYKHELTHLLDTGDVLCNVFDGHRVLDGESMRLALDTGFVNQDTTVGGET